MHKVLSKDGTSIAYDRFGQGLALIMVTGALSNRMTVNASFTGDKGIDLQSHFSIYAYDRRGRGDSGDTPPYAVEREIEDIAAMINAAGGSACLYGHSSGAVLALEAAAQLGGVTGVAVYEPPYIVDSSRPPLPEDFLEKLRGMISEDRRGEMLAHFMTFVGTPPEVINQMRRQPSWESMEAMAHTLIYESLIVKDGQKGKPLPPDLVDRLAAIKAPVLVMAGGASPAWMQSGAWAAAQAIPSAVYRVLKGQTHGVSTKTLIPELIEFFVGG